MMYTVQVGMDRFNFYLKNDRFVLETTKKKTKTKWLFLNIIVFLIKKRRSHFLVLVFRFDNKGRQFLTVDDP